MDRFLVSSWGVAPADIGKEDEGGEQNDLSRRGGSKGSTKKLDDGGSRKRSMHHIFLPVVGPLEAIRSTFYSKCWAYLRPLAPKLWPVVGPFKAIGSICNGHGWAHSKPLAAYAMAMDGPIQSHRQLILGPVVGLIKAISSRLQG